MLLNEIKDISTDAEYQKHLAQVKKDGRALQFVPKGLKTKEMCLIAVTKYGRALQFVPEGLRDREMCIAAVTQNGYALSFVPEGLKTKDKEMCLLAYSQVRDNNNNRKQLVKHHIPKGFWSYLRHYGEGEWPDVT